MRKKREIRIAKHGELRIVRYKTKKIKGDLITSDEDIILADSETTGNHHMLEMKPGVQVWNDKQSDKFLIKVDNSTKIYCVHENRHDDYTLDEGYFYEIYRAREYDHFLQRKREVVD